MALLPNPSHIHPPLSEQVNLLVQPIHKVESAAPADLAGTQPLEMYPIQNTDFDKCPYGYRVVLLADLRNENIKIILLSKLFSDWLTTMALRKLKGLSIWNTWNNFSNSYHQCIFASSNPDLNETILELDLRRRPWAEVTQFLEATRL